MSFVRVLDENEWPVNYAAMPRDRAEALQRDWRQFRRAWLILLARCASPTAETLSMLSKDERDFVDYVRARGGVV